jgi:hypothetical protein
LAGAQGAPKKVGLAVESAGTDIGDAAEVCSLPLLFETILTMRLAYVHVLPLELYPPATNTLDILAEDTHLEIRAYTSPHRNSLQSFRNANVAITRRRSGDGGGGLTSRLFRHVWWHLPTAQSLRRWHPDVLLYVEPHSAIAAYLYYRLYRGRARLFIHHHEYYAPEDFRHAGIRTARLGHRLEQAWLFPRAEWISQTNQDRLDLFRRDNPQVAEGVCQVWPNYPPKQWTTAMRDLQRPVTQGPLRFVYVGSASFEDTYIREVVTWIGSRSDSARLHVCGHNVSPSVWAWIAEQGFDNITVDSRGCEYAELPALLAEHDIGLILYKGNTINFVYNAPNKLFEYLRCGLDVWYPREMAGIRRQCDRTPGLPVREMDFTKLDQVHVPCIDRLEGNRAAEYAFNAEDAMRPLLTTFDCRGGNRTA